MTDTIRRPFPGRPGGARGIHEARTAEEPRAQSAGRRQTALTARQIDRSGDRERAAAGPLELMWASGCCPWRWPAPSLPAALSAPGLQDAQGGPPG
jgi:hypothetical protein